VRRYQTFLHVWSFCVFGKTVIQQEMPYRETVSSGRYMNWAGKNMLKMLLDWLFWGCFVGAETVFFLGKNCFCGRRLLVVCVPFFAYHACAVVSAFHLDC
jgi:hypothetical protein